MWQMKVNRELGLESTLRPRGGLRKELHRDEKKYTCPIFPHFSKKRANLKGCIGVSVLPFTINSETIFPVIGPRFIPLSP